MLTVTTPDIGKTIEDLSKRLYAVEQKASGPNVGGSGFGDNPNVDTITVGGIIIRPEASPPTGLILTTGSFMEDIWVDAEWTAPADGSAVQYDVELARKVAGVYELIQAYRTSGTSLRMNALEPQTVYGVRVASINRIGRRSTLLPPSGFQDITTGIDATVPSQVSNVQMTAGFKTVTIRWNEVAERDVARGTGQYQVDLATDSGFTANLRTQYDTGTIVAFGDLTTGTTYFARVRAIDNSGNAGAYSTTVSATTGQVTNPDVANLAIGTAQIQDAAIITAKIANLAVDDAKIANLDAAKITVGTLNAARIAANSLDVEKLASSSMSTVNLTITGSGAIKVNNPPTTGLLINSQGLRLYSGGVAKVILDNNGNATFSGNVDASTITSSSISSTNITGGTITGSVIQTAASGRRIAMAVGGVFDTLSFYSGLAAETAVGFITVSDNGGTDPAIYAFAPKEDGYRGALRLQANKATQNTFNGAELFVQDNGGNTGIAVHAYRDVSGGFYGFRIMGLSTDNPEHRFEPRGLSGFQTPRVVSRRFSTDTIVTDYVATNGQGGAIGAFSSDGNTLIVTAIGGNGYGPIKASAFNLSSSRERKKDIAPVTSSMASILSQINVVTYIPENQFETRVGVLAEEVAQVFPQAVFRDEDGIPTGVDMGTLQALVIKTLQEVLGKVKV